MVPTPTGPTAAAALALATGSLDGFRTRPDCRPVLVRSRLRPLRVGLRGLFLQRLRVAGGVFDRPMGNDPVRAAPAGRSLVVSLSVQRDATLSSGARRIAPAGIPGDWVLRVARPGAACSRVERSRERRLCRVLPRSGGNPPAPPGRGVAAARAGLGASYLCGRGGGSGPRGATLPRLSTRLVGTARVGRTVRPRRRRLAGYPGALGRFRPGLGCRLAQTGPPVSRERAGARAPGAGRPTRLLVARKDGPDVGRPACGTGDLWRCTRLCQRPLGRVAVARGAVRARVGARVSRLPLPDARAVRRSSRAL